MTLPYINIHTHHPEPDIICLLNVMLQGVNTIIPEHDFFSTGIHPWDAHEAEDNWLDTFDFTNHRMLAIGEVGLDHRPKYDPYDTQKLWFERQIDIANAVHKPLIIHSVRATDDTIEILKNRAETPPILHNFTGSRETAQQWLRQIPNVRFSFGPTAMQSSKTEKTIRFIASEFPSQFFLETDDDPNVTILEMYTFVANLTNCDVSDLQSRITLNFNALFPKTIIK